MVNLHHQTMAADCHSSPAKRNHLVPEARRVAGVYDHRQMALLPDHRNGGKVQGIAAVVGECAHSALAQYHLVISALHHVFGRHEPLFDGGRHTPLEKNGLSGLPGPPQQAEVLHIPRADLDYVRVLLDQVEDFMVDCLGNHRHPGFLAHFGQDL